MVKPEVACFLTCGHTEMGFSQGFLEKMNPRCNFKQCLPFKKKMKKGISPSIRDDISGLTGDSLLSKIYEILHDHKERFQQYDAILIEDDLDGRFHGCSDKQILKDMEKKTEKVVTRLGKALPVFFLYASPEIESWFIADWKNGFSALYQKSFQYQGHFSRADREFFLHCLKTYIEDRILGEFSHNIEEYWRTDQQGNSLKLSDQIIYGIQTEIPECLEKTEHHRTFLERFRDAKPAYSKKEHGCIMLRNLDPDEVSKKCKRFFAPEYRKLQSFPS